MIFYWISNAIAALTILCLLGISWFISRPYKNFSSLNITLTAILVALSIVLTNLIGYNLRFLGVQISLGNFLIFLAGMLMGPLVGVVSGIVSDSVGTLVNISSSYHASFLLMKVMFGFVGALCFATKNHRWWSIKVFVAFAFICGIQIWIANPIGIYSMAGWKATWASIIPLAPKKTITWAIQMVAYPIITISAFKILWLLYSHSSYASTNIWAFKTTPAYLQKLPLTSQEELEPKIAESAQNIHDKVE